MPVEPDVDDILMDELPAPLQERHYYKILIVNLISLAITSILVIVNIAQTTIAVQTIKYERRDIIHAIDSIKTNNYRPSGP
jgi:hypothetical protein